jgi:Uma2 family endonuclease
LRDADVGVIRPFGADKGQYADPGDVLLAVEVAYSSLDYDLHRKARDYARNDIPHYWVVDAEHRLVHMMSKPLGEEYTERRPVAFGEPLPAPETQGIITIT